jgi:hypothetical protein
VLDPLYITEPVARVRTLGEHRIEAYGPKLASRATSYRRPLLEQWLPLKVNPKVITFCERPGYVLTNGYRRLADFWIRSERDHRKFNRKHAMARWPRARWQTSCVKPRRWACRRLDV